uniref:Uncharacterized protein n=1 Tax=Peromyscus maniculatus bairdii TaxID=230844 RepID=A0A8C8W4Y1_PERMB
YHSFLLICLESSIYFSILLWLHKPIFCFIGPLSANHLPTFSMNVQNPNTILRGFLTYLKQVSSASDNFLLVFSYLLLSMCTVTGHLLSPALIRPMVQSRDCIINSQYFTLSFLCYLPKRSIFVIIKTS